MTRKINQRNVRLVGATLATPGWATMVLAQSIVLNTLHDVTDFGGAQQMANLPGPDGRVSFQEACRAANNTSGPQTIEFAIPTSEFWLITNMALLKLDAGLFLLSDDDTTIDFGSQTRNVGDTNPAGPEVGIYGLQPNGWGSPAIIIQASDCVIRGLGGVWQRGAAVAIWGGAGNRIVGCQTGTIEIGWGGETQALIFNPHTKKVIGINALGVAPTGATVEAYKAKGLSYPPEYGPLAAVTPGTPGGLMVMVAEYGKLSLKDVLAPAIQMADGFPIEAQLANTIERQKSWIKQWPYSKAVLLRGAAAGGLKPAAPQASAPQVTPAHDVVITMTNTAGREAPAPGEMFRQPDLAATLRKLVDTEQQALKRGKSRKEAIYAAYDRFYKGDIAQEIARSTQEQGGWITADDLAKWQVRTEEPVKTSYKGIDVYKLTVWTQGPAMLQMLNILENFDLKPMGYNSARYIHTVYQAMSLAFADRDFYYGDPYFPPAEPVAGLLSKEYARDRAKRVNPERNDPTIAPGDPYPYQGEKNPFLDVLRLWNATATKPRTTADLARFDESFRLGTTSVEAADEEGWVVSITPSGGWMPAVIAGKTGIGLSQRAQSFDTDPNQNPFNVIEPGKRPHVTLTPTLALKDGAPFLAFAVQGGDTQDQNLLQFFLNVVEFGMTPQEAAEAANFNTFQVRKWLGDRQSVPGRILLDDETPAWVRSELRRMGYDLTFEDRTSGPINAIWFDRAHGTMWGGSSNHGEDYGIAW